MDAEQQQNQQYRAAAGQTDHVVPEPSGQPATPSGDRPSAPPPIPPTPPRHARFRVPRLKIRYALVALGLLVAGVAAAVYFLYWQNPTRILGSAVTKTASAKTLHYSGNVKLHGEVGKDSEELRSAGLSFTFASDFSYRGDYDGSDGNNPKLTMALDGKADLGELGKYDGAFEGRYLNNTLYGALTRAPKNESFDLEGFTNLWIKSPVEKNGDKPPNEYVKPLSKQENDRLKAALKKYKLVSKLTTEKGERIDGVASRHYKVTIDYKQLKEAAPGLAEIASRESFDEKEKQEIRDSIVEPKTVTPIDVWVSKKDGTIRKVFSHDETTAGGDTPYTVTSDSTLLISKVNQPVSISAPEKSLTEKELEKEAESDADKDGLVDLAERYFKTNPKNPDSDGDKFKDGQEAARGFDPAGPGKLSDQEKSLYELFAAPRNFSEPPPTQPASPVLAT